MTETTNLYNRADTAALQVVIELIRQGSLKTGVLGREATQIIETHKQLTEYFDSIKPAPKGNGPSSLA